MAFSDYSTTPSVNTNLAGIDVGEGCPPANMNNAVRQLMADGKLLSNQVGGLSGAMPIAGGAFTGDITREGKGAYLHYAASALTAGQVYVLPVGTARPTAAEGVIVFYY